MKTARIFSALLAMAALSAACYKESSYNSLTGVDAVLALRTDPASASIPADGTSRITVVAKISERADASKRTILFETTSGTLSGGTASGSARAVVADANGEAAVQLQSSSIVETATVTASVQGVSGVQARVDVHFVAFDPSSVLRFTSAPSSAPADGATISTFVVEVTGAASLPAANRTVAFTTTMGTLVQSSVLLDGSGTARALLKSDTRSGTAVLRATLGTLAADTVVRFDPAPAESLAVTSDKFAIRDQLEDKAAIKVELRRATGTVSAATRIDLAATDASGKPIGLFSANPIYSGDSGNATTDFAVNGEYEGPVTIVATVPGTNVAGSTVIQVKKQ